MPWTPPKLTSFYPVICSERLAESVDFYTRHFGFEKTFEADWYVSLRQPQPPYYELALLDYTHPTMPADYRKPVQGLCSTSRSMTSTPSTLACSTAEGWCRCCRSEAKNSGNATSSSPTPTASSWT